MTTSQGLTDQLTEASRANGWDFSTFRMEWNPSGGGDGGGTAGSQGQPAQNQGGQQGQGSGSPASQGQQQQQGGQPDYSLASGFLDRVAPEHRAIVEPYVKQWDAGVTRRFGELHSQYQPYTELGDIEDVRAAMGLVELMDQDPWKVYGVLHEALMGQQPPQGMPGQQPPGFPGQQVPGQQMPGQLSGQPPQQQEQQGGLPPEFRQEFDSLRQMTVALAEHLLGQQRETSEAEEDAQLDQFLGGLHEEFGDFDERYVLGAIASGETPDAAINAWNQAVTQAAQGQLQKNNQVPMILGGGGAVPTGGQPTVQQLDRKQTRSLVENVLAQAAQQRQG